MQKTLFYTLLAICLLTLASCKQRKEATRILVHAQEIMETYPDSALMLLDSIRLHAGRLDKNHRMQYEVAIVQARYKNYRDIKDDTAVFEARRYFLKTDNYEQQTLASLYSGCVYEERTDYEKAINAYEEALYAAQRAYDTLLMGRCLQHTGSLLNRQGFYNEALAVFKKAIEVCESLPEKQAEYYGNTGRLFLLTGVTDSAFYYFRKGIDLAVQIDDRQIQSQLLQNMSVAYRECKMYDEALQYLRQSIQPENINNSCYHLNLAELFDLMHQNDSSSYYMELLKKDLSNIKDKNLLASAYSFLSKNAADNNMYDTAYLYQKQYGRLVEDITNERLQQSVFEARQKYNLEAEQNRHYIQLLNRQRYIILLSVSLLVAAVAIISFIFKLLKSRKKESDLKDKLLFLEHENTTLNGQKNDLSTEINTLKQEKKQLESQNDSLQNKAKIDNIQAQILKLQSELEHATSLIKDNVQWRTALLCKTVIIDNDKILNNKNMQFEYAKKIIFDSQDSSWNAIFTFFDKTYPNLSDKIRTTFPDLNDVEFKVCILSFMPLSLQDNADILSISTNTVAKHRSNIRKKIKMEETGGSIPDTIRKIIG